MILSDIRDLLDAVILARREDMGIEIERAYCADLMSDVLAFSISNSLLITGLTNTQVIRTAEVATIRAIVFIQNKRPDIQTISLADEKKIPLLVVREILISPDNCPALLTPQAYAKQKLVCD
jgi:hypothetical protein